ncbi:MAG: hypothetical protein WDO15_29505 [Bacteroidota bacterium]
MESLIENQKIAVPGVGRSKKHVGTFLYHYGTYTFTMNEDILIQIGNKIKDARTSKDGTMQDLANQAK